MRLIQLRAPSADRDAVREVLEERDIEFVTTEEGSADGTAALVQFPLPAAAVDDVFEARAF